MARPLGRGVTDAPALDRPWRRPGGLRYALTRLHGALRPPVVVEEPPPGAVQTDHDVGVATRDGTVLHVNVYRPPGAGPFPVLLCAHPYGKDRLPVRTRRGYRVSFQYRALRQTGPVRFSNLTTWEAPDPAWWAQQGYALVNCDLRGAGTSDGRGALLSDQEGEDVADLIEWAGRQPWSTGTVGLLGVSYLALSQWKAAGLAPGPLRAICPWEGFTDAYRDLLFPGGVREDGFVRLWSRGLRHNRLVYQIRAEQRDRPCRDEFWRSLVPDLGRIRVPALVCGSFSDNNLHSRGSLRGFEQIGSADRFLYTHRSGKWATFYSAEARRARSWRSSTGISGAGTSRPRPGSASRCAPAATRSPTSATRPTGRSPAPPGPPSTSPATASRPSRRPSRGRSPSTPRPAARPSAGPSPPTPS